MKKYLFIALAALGFAACAEKDDHNLSVNNGETEQSYIAVTFSADDLGTRAPGDAYDEGTTDEREVKCAHFFFFDGNDQPFVIDGTNNWLRVGVADMTDGEFGADNTGDGKPNVSDVKTIMAIKNYKGEYPSQIVAVLNMNSALAATYTLDALSKELVNINGEGDAFVMSNSVYAEESQKLEINATVLTPANIGKTQDEAKQNAVTIHVERLAAKVVVKADGDNNGDVDNTYKVGEVDGQAVYAKILGWDFYNEYYDSRLVKDIDPTWTGAIGFPWNNQAYYRSYWAVTPERAFPEDNMVSYNSLGKKLEKADQLQPYYCGENTLADDKTEVVLKAQFVKDGGSNVEVATWMAHSYLGEKNLRTVVANSLANRIYYKESGEYKSITPDDLKVVEADEVNPNNEAELKAYHVFFQLSDGNTKDWYLYSAETGFVYNTNEKINIVLGGVEPALLYKGGQAYYHTTIKHLGAPETETEFGVVRNHSYVVNVTKIDGFGTPVFDPNTKFVPETPEDFKTFVAADVRILSWRVVDPGYEI